MLNRIRDQPGLKERYLKSALLNREPMDDASSPDLEPEQAQGPGSVDHRTPGGHPNKDRAPSSAPQGCVWCTTLRCILNLMVDLDLGPVKERSVRRKDVELLVVASERRNSGGIER